MTLLKKENFVLQYTVIYMNVRVLYLTKVLLNVYSTQDFEYQ